MKNLCRSSSFQSLAICSPGFQSSAHPLLFSGWTLELCCAFLVSIPSLLTHPAPQSAQMHSRKYPVSRSHSQLNNLSSVPGNEKRHQRRKEEKRCWGSCGFKANLCTPWLLPVSISSLAPPGTQGLAGPQEPGSQDQAEREKRGNKRREEECKKEEKKNKNKADPNPSLFSQRENNVYEFYCFNGTYL